MHSARCSRRMEMGLSRIPGEGWKKNLRRRSRESKLKSGTGLAEPSYSEEVVPSQGLDASRGINRSPTDSSLWFLTYNRRRELWDFCDADRRTVVMQHARDNDRAIVMHSADGNTEHYSKYRVLKHDILDVCMYVDMYVCTCNVYV